MRTCPGCHRVYPEVAGADAQKCPFCGQEVSDPAPVPAEAAPDLADPVGALSHAARFVRARYPSLLLLWVPVALLDAAVSLSVAVYQARTPGTEDLGRLSSDQALALLGVISPIYLLDFVVTFAAWAWIARLVLGPHAKPLRLGAVLGMGALLTLALLAGLVLLVVPALILFHMFLFAPAALAAGAGVGGSFDESRRFSRERGTTGFTALMVLLSALLLAVSYALSVGVDAALDAMGVASPYARAALEALPGWLVWPLLPVLPASYWRLAHAAPQEPAPQAAAPASPAVARLRSTKCPKCATLIPYEATGAPVEVRCPMCGASGRVL